MLLASPGTTAEEIQTDVELISTLVITILEREGKKGLSRDGDGFEKLEAMMGPKAEIFASELMNFLGSPYPTPQQYDSNVTYVHPDAPDRVWNFGKEENANITDLDVIDLTSERRDGEVEAKPDSFILIESDTSDSEEPVRRRVPKRTRQPSFDESDENKKAKVEILIV
jgi:hypothetical protein